MFFLGASNKNCYNSVDNQEFVEELQFERIPNMEIYAVSCMFKEEGYHQQLFNYLNIYYPMSLDNAVNKRCAEFLAGRYVAREVLRKSAWIAEPIPTITVGKNRMPNFPFPIAGSISHTDNLAVCAIVKSAPESKRYLGIDVESYMSIVQADEVWKSIHTRQELSLAVEQGISREIATTLYFSAKESLFKAIYPQIGFYFGFEVAQIISVNLQKSKLMLCIVSAKQEFAHYKNKIFECNFKLHDNYVSTLLLTL